MIPPFPFWERRGGVPPPADARNPSPTDYERRAGTHIRSFGIVDRQIIAIGPPSNFNCHCEEPLASQRERIATSGYALLAMTAKFDSNLNVSIL